MSIELDNFLAIIKKAKKNLSINRQAAEELGCAGRMLNLFDKIIALVNILEEKAKGEDLEVNYVNQFQLDIENILSNLTIQGHQNVDFVSEIDQSRQDSLKKQIENSAVVIL